MLRIKQYRMFKKYFPFVYSKYTFTNGQGFLDIQCKLNNSRHIFTLYLCAGGLQWTSRATSSWRTPGTTGSRSSTRTEPSCAPSGAGARATASSRDWRALPSTPGATSSWPTGRTTGYRYSRLFFTAYLLTRPFEIKYLLIT